MSDFSEEEREWFEANPALCRIVADILRERLRLMAERAEAAEAKLAKADDVLKLGKEMFETTMLTGGGSPDAWSEYVKARNAFRDAFAELEDKTDD